MSSLSEVFLTQYYRDFVISGEIFNIHDSYNIVSWDD